MQEQHTLQLQWFFDFMATGLATSSDEEQKKLADQMEKIVGRSDVDRAKTGTFALDEMQRFQRRLREFYEGVSQKIAAMLKYQDGEGRPGETAEFHPQFGLLDGAFTVRLVSEIPHEVLPSDDDSPPLVRPEPGAVKGASFSLEIRAKDPEKVLLWHFMLALRDQATIGSLLQCLECQKWFFHISKREKQYCSTRCAARRINREKRAKMKREDPKAYEEELEKGKERAKKSYQRRVKKKLPGA